jgi:hypothetical protein
LVTRPIPGFPLTYRPEAVEHIIALTRCQPLLVQLLCRQLVNLLNQHRQREADIEDIEAIVPGVLTEGRSIYFKRLADETSSIGRAILAELARVGPGATPTEAALTRDDDARRAAMSRLLERGLVERAGGGVRFQIELTRRWWESYVGR